MTNVIENSEMVRVNRINKAYGSYGPRTPSQPDESMLSSCYHTVLCEVIILSHLRLRLDSRSARKDHQ